MPPEHLMPPGPEQKLIALVGAQLSAARNADETVRNALYGEGPEGQRLEVVQWIERDSDEKYIPTGDERLPDVYEKLVWNPDPQKRHGVDQIVTRMPIYDGPHGQLFWPNDVLFAITREDLTEEKFLLNGFGWQQYRNPQELCFNDLEGDDAWDRSQNLLRMRNTDPTSVPVQSSAGEAKTVSAPRPLTVEEVLDIIENSLVHP